MKLSTPISVVIAGALIAAAVVVQARLTRYELVGAGSGSFLRIDRASGRAAFCRVRSDESGPRDSNRYSLVCDKER